MKNNELDIILNQYKTRNKRFSSPINLPSVIKKQKVIPKNVFYDNEFEIEKNNSISEKKSLVKTEKYSIDTLATAFLEKFHFLNVDDNLYIWDKETGLYKLLFSGYADRFIRINTPDHLKHKINKYSIQEILLWMKSKLPVVSEDILKKKHTKFIALKNGVLNLANLKLSSYSPEHFFTSSISATFDPKCEYNGENFENFLMDVTNGDTNLYLRIQELFGYVISGIRNVKYIPYLIGPKDTGKSIMINLLEKIIGEKCCSNLNISQLNDDKYLGELIGKKLNTCAEVSESKLGKLDVLKSLVGTDKLTARPLYSQPINFCNDAVLLFAGNHLPKLKGTDSSNAFSQRIVIFPFLHQIPKEEQDPFLIEKLISEKSYIVEWAIKGLKRWQEQNYIFTETKISNRFQKAYESSSNSIETFINKYCTYDLNFRIHKSDLYISYQSFCEDYELSHLNSKEFNAYLATVPNLEYSRFRLNGKNSFGYIGITTTYKLDSEGNV